MGIRVGENYFIAKLAHLDSFTTNLGEKIIKKSNFQKRSQIGSHWTPFRTPHGTHGGPNELLVKVNIHLVPP